MTASALPRISAVRPLWAVEGGSVTIEGSGFAVDPALPEVRIGGAPGRVVFASARRLCVLLPEGLDGGRTPIRLESSPGETAYVEVGAPIVTGVHQVDSPVFDQDGNLYVTFSGSRGQETAVSVFVVRRPGAREPFVAGIPNPTSMAIGPDGAVYVSSRFDGTVYRVAADGSFSVFAADLGVACGIAFHPGGDLFVGDRSGAILRVASGRATQFASLPPSVAAFHLAFGPDEWLYVTAPTLGTRDGVYRLSPDGRVEKFFDGFGRPQGLAFDDAGRLYVVDALAGNSGVYRLDVTGPPAPDRVVAGGALIGLAFDPRGGLVLASGDSAYRLDVPHRALRL